MTRHRRFFLASLLVACVGMILACAGGMKKPGSPQQDTTPKAATKTDQSPAAGGKPVHDPIVDNTKEIMDRQREEQRRAEVLNKAATRVTDLKAKLLAAQQDEAQAKQQATQARADADKATEKADKDYRTLLGTRAAARVYQDYMNEDKQAAKSKEEAKVFIEKARQAEAKAQQATIAVSEARADVRQAESDLLQAELAPK